MINEENIPDVVRASGKKLPFDVPESYFEDLPARIQGRVSAGTRPRNLNLRPRLAMAAMFIGLIAVGYAGFRILSGRDNGSYLSEQELREAMEYLAYDIDEELLVSAVLESDITLAGESSDASDEIIQYLSEEDIDFSELLDDF